VCHTLAELGGTAAWLSLQMLQVAHDTDAQQRAMPCCDDTDSGTCVLVGLTSSD
jgi:hypothetical protein